MIKSKAFTRFLSFLLCAVFLLCCAIPFLPVSAAEGGDVLVVGVPTDRCPIFYIDDATGDISGIGVDLMRAVGDEVGYDISFRAVTEDTLKSALDNPDYDVILPFGSAVASASGESTIVSEDLMQTPFTLVTYTNEKLPPLNNLRVGMLKSLTAVAETVERTFPGIQITLYDTMDDCVAALRSGEVDALLHNSYVWSYILQKPAYSDLMVQPSTMFSMSFRAGTINTPNGQTIIRRINRGINAMSDTKRQAIILDYTSRRLYKKNLSDYLYEYRITLILGVVIMVLLIFLFIQQQRTFRRENEQQIRQLIDRDPLTGVLSMNGFRKRVEEILSENPDTPYLLTYGNIIDFKFINAKYGMEAGDELLRLLAENISELLSDEDEAVGRIEADHFVALRKLVSEDLVREAEKAVVDPARDFFINRGHDTRVQICSGIYVLTPEDYENINVYRIIDFARVAEKKQSSTRKDGYAFYNPEQWQKGKRSVEICGHFPTAVKNGELQVWYQPQMDYKTGQIIGAEALCRWISKKLGPVSPGEYIPILEEAGLIYEMDCFVWEQVCRDLKRWNEEGHHRTVSVNLSRGDISEDRNIPGHFFNLMQTYGLTPDQLHIEITETAYAESPELLINETENLREFGFQVEMDDFGSGLSSLHMLKEVNVDRIKLDLNFLSGSNDEKGEIVVSHIVKMIHALGMELIAEGVETKEQADFLLGLGCNEMQGYYFYKPMRVDEVEKLANK